MTISLFGVNQLVSIRCIVTGLWAGRSEIRFPVEGKDFFPLQIVHTKSASHPAFYSMRAGDVKRSGCEATYLNLSSGDKNDWSHTSTLYSSMEWTGKNLFFF